MPMFERGDKSGAYVEPTRDFFPRGQRLPPEAQRRIRDILYTALYSAGMDPEDIAMIFRGGVCPRQIRNRVDKVPPSFKSLISLAVFEAMKSIQRRHGRLAEEFNSNTRKPCRRRRARTTGNSFRQLPLFPPGLLESGPSGSPESTPNS